MPFDPKLTITGLQEAQAANNRRIAALKPSGAFGRAIQYATTAAHRYAIAETHVDTGALRASHRMEISGLRGRVFIDPGAANPRSGRLTSLYGFYEHERGGSHAFYANVVATRRDEIVAQAEKMIAGAL